MYIICLHAYLLVDLSRLNLADTQLSVSLALYMLQIIPVNICNIINIDSACFLSRKVSTGEIGDLSMAMAVSAKTEIFCIGLTFFSIFTYPNVHTDPIVFENNIVLITKPKVDSHTNPYCACAKCMLAIQLVIHSLVEPASTEYSVGKQGASLCNA